MYRLLGDIDNQGGGLVGAGGTWQISVLSPPFLKNFYFILKYSQLTMLWQFQVDDKDTQPYIYVIHYPLPSRLAHNIEQSSLPLNVSVTLKLLCKIVSEVQWWIQESRISGWFWSMWLLHEKLGHRKNWQLFLHLILSFSLADIEEEEDKEPRL